MSYIIHQSRKLAWLLFFSSLPSKPVGNRVKVWRKLVKIGAVQLKGTVYVLPDGPQHREFFQWLAAEIGGMGGEAAFVRVERVELVTEAEIVALFDRRKAVDYHPLEKALASLARKIDAERQGGRASAAKAPRARFAKLLGDFEEARGTDFFDSAAGRDLGERIDRVRLTLAELPDGAERTNSPTTIPERSPGDYLGKRWVTRRGPFIDRMASAWLIRRFIDPSAAFGFIDEAEVAALAPGTVAFDVRGGQFTHVGDRCTFEVFVRAFSLKDAALAKIAQLVHDLDLKDERYRRPEAAGVEEILEGVRRLARDDADALERGMAVFEMLYAALGR